LNPKTIHEICKYYFQVRYTPVFMEFARSKKLAGLDKLSLTLALFSEAKPPTNTKMFKLSRV